jgi:hypothetical protein
MDAIESPQFNAGVLLSATLRKPDLRMRLYDVILFLKKQGYSLENSFVSYFSQVFSSYVNCNLDPISKTIWLSEDDLEVVDEKLALRLKF